MKTERTTAAELEQFRLFSTCVVASASRRQDLIGLRRSAAFSITKLQKAIRRTRWPGIDGEQ
jgi:hypothetical protein